MAYLSLQSLVARGLAANKDYTSLTVATNGDIYAQDTYRGMYVCSGGVGNFTYQDILGAIPPALNLASSPNGDVFGLYNSGVEIYKRTGSAGNFALHATAPARPGSGGWTSICIANNTDLYITGWDEGIRYQPLSSGGFSGRLVPILTVPGGGSLAADTAGNVFALVTIGGLWKQTGGVGSFVEASLSETKPWSGITILPNGDKYLIESGGVWKQVGDGPLERIVDPADPRNVGWNAITSSPDGSAIYVSNYSNVFLLDIPNNPPVIETVALTTPRCVDVAFSEAIVVSGEATPFSFSIENGSLPDGVALNPSTGNVEGTPTLTGTFVFDYVVVDTDLTEVRKTFTIEVVNCTREAYKEYTLVVPDCAIASNEGYKTYTLVVSPCVIDITIGQTEFNVCYNSSFYHKLAASGGIAPYTYSFPTGGLPPSLILNGDEILGVVSQQGPTTAVLRVTDAVDTVKDFVLTFNIPYALALNSALILPAVPTEYYEQQLVITGLEPGEGSITLDPVQLPAGLTYDDVTHTISGTTLQEGTFSILTILSNGVCSNEYRFNLRVYKLQLEPYALCVYPNLPFYTRLTTLNGVSPFTWSVVGDPLPDYLVLNTLTGEITGSAATEEVVYTGVRVVDGLGSSTEVDLTVTVSSLCGEMGGIVLPPDFPPVAPGRAPWIPSLQSKSTLVAANYFSDNLIKYLPNMYEE